MWRRRLAEALAILSLTTWAGLSPASAQEPSAPGALLELPLPGGLRAAVRAAGDLAAPDRCYFLLDIIRGSQSGTRAQREARNTARLALAEHLEMAATTMPADARAASRETLPLPLPPSVWIDVVFGGGASPDGLAAAILRSRGASLLYSASLSLDDATRAWLAGQPQLLSDLAARHAAPFLLAAPALRVDGAVVRVPGGAAAEAGWETLVGTRVTDPPQFVRALLSADEGRLAYMFGATAALTPEQLRFALNLDAPVASSRVAALQRLRAVFNRITVGWDVHDRTFWQPGADPVLLLTDIRVDGQGRPMVPGTRRFWELAFRDAAPHPAAISPSDLLDGPPVDFSWLCEQVFRGAPGMRSRRYLTVLFASRLGPALSRRNAADGLEAVRAAGAYPALIAALERARLADPVVMARAARRAAQLSSSRNAGRANRAITQYQGALALLVRAVSRGTIAPGALPDLVSSLAAVSPGESGDYEGALARWVAARLIVLAPGPPDEALLTLAAGPAPVRATYIDWEGTRYRVDLARAEAMRISRLLGPQPRPYVSAAVDLAAMADAMRDRRDGPSAVHSMAAELARVAHALGWADGEAWPAEVLDRYRTLVASLERPLREGAEDLLARALGVLADDLLARGLGTLAYAAALGQPERSWLTAEDVSSRHDFGSRPLTGRSAAWDFPENRSVGMRAGLGVTGALLGMDLPLAELSLQRLSVRPPPRKPMLSEATRRGFVESVTLVQPAFLNDRDQDAMVAAIALGRERVAAVRSGGEAAVLAGTLRLDPARASLFAWAASHDRPGLAAFLAPGELLWLGMGAMPLDSPLHAWGAPARARTGFLCLRLPVPQPWSTVAGRAGSGLLASLFPDLHLRLAELLAEARLPATLLSPVLASATLDFVNSAISRDDDDRRGLLEFVRGLDADRLERYLALLTTDGALFPLDDVTAPAASTELRP